MENRVLNSATRRVVGRLAVMAMVMSVASSASAAIRLVSVGQTSFRANDRTPLFRGRNSIRVVGSDPGITLASGVELRDGACPTPIVSGRVVAVGSITRRDVRDYAGASSLIINLPLTTSQRLGNFCVIIRYPAGNMTVDSFRVRVFRRGAVTSIQAPSTARGNTDVDITWNGVGIGNATFNQRVTPMPFTVVRRVQSTESRFTLRVRFGVCGTHTIFAPHIYDRSVPESVALDAGNRYQGRASATIRVTEDCGARPRPTPRPAPPTIRPSPRCGGVNQPPCP